jgi:hypothetical protein
MLFLRSLPISPIHAPTRRPLKDLLRCVLLTCVLLLSCLTFSNLQYVQRTVDSFEIETLPFLFSASQHHSTIRQVNNPKQAKRNYIVSSSEISTDSEDDLPCLIHESFSVNAPSRRVSDPNQTVLQSQQAPKCGKLKRKWMYNPPLSKMARQIERHQTNCSTAVATHHFDNTFGLGAHFILWGQAMCNAMQVKTSENNSYRVQSRSPETWLWLDQTHCSIAQARDESPLACYFPKAERRCDESRFATDEFHSSGVQLSTNVSDPRNKKLHCPWVRNSHTRSLFRAAATEYLFQQVSPLVIQEAKRQVGVVFASNDGVVPDDLVTVHVRWGDKFWEMDLPPIEEYIQAIHNLTQYPANGPRDARQFATNETSRLNVYLATEDPKAYDAFMQAKPEEWTVYADITLMEINAFRPHKGNRASWATRNTKGRAGLVALGSLLVAMEANRFILTTKSNWSTLMNHLRTNVIDPRCRNCTTMIDLRPGEYY